MTLCIISLRALWRVYCALLFSITFVVLYPVFVFLLARESRYPVAFTLKRIVALITIWFSGIRIKVKRLGERPEHTPFIICSNHTSYLDIIVCYCIFTNYFVFIGKQELKKVPLFRIFFKDMDIAVDRSSRISAHSAFIRAANDIDKGRSVIMFPEGTIPRRFPEMSSFKNGPFKLAIEKQIPILPVAFLNNYKIFPQGKQNYKLGGPGVANVTIHRPIPTKGMTEKNLINLRQQVFDLLDNTLKEYENR